jgi:hypothetical protein
MFKELLPLIINKLSNQVSPVLHSCISMKEFSTCITKCYPFDSPPLFPIGFLLLEQRNEL